MKKSEITEITVRRLERIGCVRKITVTLKRIFEEY